MLTGLSGVGESVANKLIEYFGNEQAAFEALIEGKSPQYHRLMELL